MRSARGALALKTEVRRSSVALNVRMPRERSSVAATDPSRDGRWLSARTTGVLGMRS